MGELNDQLLEAYATGNEEKARAIENKIKRLCQKYDEIRDQTEDAVNEFSDLVVEVHEQISDLISQDITGTTEKEKEEIDDELGALQDEIDNRKSTIAKDAEKVKVMTEVIEIKEKPPEKRSANIEKEKKKKRVLIPIWQSYCRVILSALT